MQGEQLRHRVGVACGPLHRGSDHAVELLSFAVRQPSVSGVADQRVLESELPARLRNQERRQIPPRLQRQVGNVLGEHGRGELAGERLAEHRRVAQERLVAWTQAVDLRRDHRFHGIRQTFQATCLPCGREQLLQEQRVAAGALRERRDLVGLER